MCTPNTADFCNASMVYVHLVIGALKLLIYMVREERSIVTTASVCLQAYLWNYMSDLHQFLCTLSVTVARSSTGGVAIRYVLPILWITSYLLICHKLATVELS